MDWATLSGFSVVDEAAQVQAVFKLVSGHAARYPAWQPPNTLLSHHVST
jgi:hypothetical protein